MFSRPDNPYELRTVYDMTLLLAPPQKFVLPNTMVLLMEENYDILTNTSIVRR
jgi:hypothetical protein